MEAARDGDLGLHRPGAIKEALNVIGLRPIEPGDIGNAPEIIEKFPDLGGDPELGIGNDGDCPSWVGDKYWYKRFLKENGVRT
ncbi:MAG: hypothetical protein M1484_03685 [Patescibacteria group bacterium]|nr:hypothetical protein [Patescibacteria group bacterium]MCL5432162.1 hypothetical protein [Patescibacteria group bacterium]